MFIHVDSYNKFLLTLTDTSNLVLFDFYTSKFLKAVKLKGKVIAIRPAKHSQLIGISFNKGVVEIWDLELLKNVRRKDIAAVANDLVFTPDSKKVILAGKCFIKL